MGDGVDRRPDRAAPPAGDRRARAPRAGQRQRHPRRPQRRRRPRRRFVCRPIRPAAGGPRSGGMRVHQRRRRPHGPLRQRAPLGGGARARDRRRRGHRAPSRPAAGAAHAGASTRFEADAAPAIRAAAELVARALPPYPEELLGLRARRLARDGRPARPPHRRRRARSASSPSAEWRLDPLPAARAGLRVALRTLDALGDAVDRAARARARRPSSCSTAPSSSCVGRGRPRSRAAGGDGAGRTSRRREPRWSAPRRPWRPGPPASIPALTPAAAERLWALRHAASPILAGLPETRRSLQVIEDGCVPVERTGRLRPRRARGGRRARTSRW